MGQPVMILGASGSGKSTSLRNFKRGECIVLNISGKRLPFKNSKKDGIEVYSLAGLQDEVRYQKIRGCILEYQDRCKTFVIDDSQFLMAFELMNKVSDRGYDKFTQIAKNWSDLMNWIMFGCKDDVIVYFLHHVEYESTNNTYKAKTVGKMVDQYMSPESLCTVVLGAKNNEGKYVFQTHNGGNDTIKSPMGMFEQDEIDNDLKVVDKVIREYYGFDEEGD